MTALEALVALWDGRMETHELGGDVLAYLEANSLLVGGEPLPQDEVLLPCGMVREEYLQLI